jgi:hypothetical protein
MYSRFGIYLGIEEDENMTSSAGTVSFIPAFIPVRQIDYRGNLTVRYLYPDGSEPHANILTPDPSLYPETNIGDSRYKLESSHGSNSKRRKNNLDWLSTNRPFLFERLLNFLEGIPEEEAVFVSRCLESGLSPERVISEEYIEAYYRVMFQTSTLCTALARDGFGGRNDAKVSSYIFTSARTACGYTVIHPHFRAAVLAIWITQDHYVFPRTPIFRYHAEDLAFIDSHFDDVYAARHELMRRGDIDKSAIEHFLKHDGPLRLGAL